MKSSPRKGHVPTIVYTSNNEKVAAVSSSGTITAKSAGTAVITATMNWQGKTYTGTCTVTVEPAAGTPEKLSAEVVRLVNAERAKEGLPPLGTLRTLTAAAQLRAPEVIRVFSHTRPDGSDCFTALKDANVTGYYIAGENIASGSRTAEDVMALWMNSPGHRSNILKKEFTHIGAACLRNGSGYGWVQMFVGLPGSGR